MDVLLAELKALHHQEAENRDIKHSLKELLKIMTKVETILAKTSTDVDTLIAVASGTTAISAPADVIAAQALSDKVAAAIGNTPVIVLTAKSSALPLTGPSPLSVQFSSKGSANPDGSALAFSWTFGDNSAVDTTPSPIHVYSAPGTYSATLVVTNLAGQQATATVITIVAS
jgi:PKD repeat protein